MCTMLATHAPLFSLPTHCEQHANLNNYLGDPLYVLFPSDKSHPQCAAPGCNEYALFAPNGSENNYPVYCEGHADSDGYHRIDIIAQPCISCAKMAILSATERACAQCSHNVSRETRLLDVLDLAGLEPTFANNVSPRLNWLRMRDYPNFVFETAHTILFINIDAHQHNCALGNIFALTFDDFRASRDYDLRAPCIVPYIKKREIALMTRIARAFREELVNEQPRAVVFLRINPDQFHDERGNIFPPVSPMFDGWAPLIVDFVRNTLARPITNSLAIAFARFKHQRAQCIDIIHVNDASIARNTFPLQPEPSPEIIPPRSNDPLNPVTNIAHIIAQLTAEKAQCAPDSRKYTTLSAKLDRAIAAQVIIETFAKTPDGQLKTNSEEYVALCKSVTQSIRKLGAFVRAFPRTS